MKSYIWMIWYVISVISWVMYSVTINNDLITYKVSAVGSVIIGVCAMMILYLDNIKKDN